MAVLQITPGASPQMGFNFRRSASFGLFRLNFSKSGVGASVGVKGARMTLSPKGTTYISVGSGGFYYRQTLSSGSRRPLQVTHPEPVEEQISSDQIKTADVEQLLESSKSELVESLNKRAQLFNPASILFVLAAACAAFGSYMVMSTPYPGALPALPDTSASSDQLRQANRTDEYALLLARYGQPSAVSITQAGPVPVRTATYESAHLAVTLVPTGCFEAYTYYEAHKNDILPSRGTRRHHAGSHTAEPTTPPCAPQPDKASTIVGYQATSSDSTVDSQTADSYLAGIGSRSAVPPGVKTSDGEQARKHQIKADSELSNVRYEEETVKDEQRRLAESVASSRKIVKIGFGLLGGALLLLVPGVLVYRDNKEKRTTRLVYELSGAAGGQQQALDETLGQLSKSTAIWRVDSQSAISDWKRNAGASYNVKRQQISVRKAVPPRVESNCVPVCVDLGASKMFFLPDQVLYWQHGTFASIDYKDLHFQAGSTRFIEEQVQTSDSQQVGSTWRYVRKDGGPDGRFSNNRQLPVMLYGMLTAASAGGLNLLLHTSSAGAANAFATSFRNFQSGRDRLMFDEVPHTGNQGKAEETRRSGEASPENVRKALELLGLKTGSSAEQVAIAYRHMAQMYHPDKVVGLGPEFQRLAEERMKELNAAHRELRQHLEGR